MERKSSNFNRKRGNALGYFIFQITVRLFGLRAAYFLLYFVCLYYLVFDWIAVKNALCYIKRRFPARNWFKYLLDVYKLFISQGKQLIDRYAALANIVKFDTSLEGRESLEKVLKTSHKGFILLTAHFGNWQTALMTLKYLKKKVFLVMRPEDNLEIEKVLGIRKKEEFIGFISSEEGADSVVKIIEAIENGSIVSIMGDRKYNFDYVGVRFLNDVAYFPYGAFYIAASVGCPVVVLLSAKTGTKSYIVNVENILYPQYENKNKESKKEQLAKFVQQFANILENYTQKFPYQCFLFHDIWKE